MDEATRDRLDCIDKKLTQLCVNQTIMQKTANIWIKVISVFMPLVIILCSYIINNQFTKDNADDFYQQQQISAMNSRLVRVEVIANGFSKTNHP